MPYGGLALRAYCISYARLIPDREKEYADLTAAALGIGIEHVIGDDFPIFEPDLWSPLPPEPVHVDPFSTVWKTMAASMGTHARAVLTGWDGDTFMSESPSHYFRFLLGRGEIRRLASGMGWYVRSQHSLPPVGLRTTLKRLLGKSRGGSPYPKWLAPAFENYLDLRHRWRRGMRRDPQRTRCGPTPSESLRCRI